MGREASMNSPHMELGEEPGIQLLVERFYGFMDTLP